MLRVVLWAKKLAKQHNCNLVIGGDLNISGVKWLAKFGLVDAINGLTFPAWEPETQIDHLLVQDLSEVKSSQIGEQSAISDHLWIALDI
jgi:endonuclease/exonuclease/phosphatase family metal-dependent hydrolase